MPSAKEVTIDGCWPHCFGEARLGGRGAVGILQALDVAAEHRAHADALHEAPEVLLHPRLVAVDVGVDRPRPRRRGPSAAGRRCRRARRSSGPRACRARSRRGRRAARPRPRRSPRAARRPAGSSPPASGPRSPRRGRWRWRARARPPRRRAPRRPGRRRHRPATAFSGVRLAIATTRIASRVHGVDLQERPRRHEARADHADPDRRIAVGDVPRERAVDEDHGVFLSFTRQSGLDAREPGYPESPFAYRRNA